MAEARFLCQVNVRAQGDAATRVSRALQLELPAQPNTFTTNGDRGALWLGPDEWLVVTEDVRSAARIESSIRAAFPPDWGTVVDVSANRVALQIAGPNARDVLATSCPLDLRPRSFGVGRCAQTLFANTPVIIWQTNDLPTFWLLVRTSFAGHVDKWLTDAAAQSTPLP